MYEPFIRAIESEGLTPPDKIIADGKKHRFDSDGQGKKTGSMFFIQTNRCPVISFVTKAEFSRCGVKIILTQHRRKGKNTV